MQTVDIVTAHNVGRHITDVALVFDLTRVENDESVVGEKAIGFEPIGVVGRQFFGVFGTSLMYSSDVNVSYPIFLNTSFLL